MNKKIFVLILIMGILCIGPANAVQIESSNQFDSNVMIEEKNLQNYTATSFENNTKDTNKTVMNKTGDDNTFINKTTDNKSMINETVNNNTNKTENNFNTKAAVIGTLTSAATISGAITSILFATTTALAAIPEPTAITKVAAVVCGIATAACLSCTVCCSIAAIFCWWLC